MNFKVRVVSNLGERSRAVFGKPGAELEVINGVLILGNGFNFTNSGHLYKNFSDLVNHFKEKDEYETIFEEAKTYTVAVKFEGNNKKYHFLCDIQVEVGDRVVVDTSRGLQVVQVKEIFQDKLAYATKWVVDVVEISGLQVKVARQNEINALKAKMERHLKNLPRDLLFKAVAEFDVETREDLAKLNSLKY